MSKQSAMVRPARALSCTAPRTAGLIVEELRKSPAPNEILVESRVSLISAGTEMVMYRGEAASALEAELPTAAGDFPFPLKYAYKSWAKWPSPARLQGSRSGTACLFTIRIRMRLSSPVRAGGGTLGDEEWPLAFRVPPDLSPEQAVFANLFCVALEFRARRPGAGRRPRRRVGSRRHGLVLCLPRTLDCGPFDSRRPAS